MFVCEQSHFHLILIIFASPFPFSKSVKYSACLVIWKKCFSIRSCLLIMTSLGPVGKLGKRFLLKNIADIDCLMYAITNICITKYFI